MGGLVRLSRSIGRRSTNGGRHCTNEIFGCIDSSASGGCETGETVAERIRAFGFRRARRCNSARLKDRIPINKVPIIKPQS
jgi:hypothetical protein